ncbi:MAG: Stp1/IreP family PP2C-type Ser/Thr phosphatase [bacterium]
MKYFVKTDAGLIRETNEDSLLILPKHGTFAVFDGMGGHAAGDLASFAASSVLDELFKNFDEICKNLGIIEKKFFLANSIQIANSTLYKLAYRYTALRGMGTTAVSCIFEDDLIHIVHVGDSRLYRLRDKTLQLLTIDHSWVNEMLEDHEITPREAKKFKNKNVITRVLGVSPTVKVDVKTENIKVNDTYLLCSDGLTSFVEEESIKDVLLNQSLTLENKAKRLVQFANENGGEDNITIIILQIDKILENSNRDDLFIGKLIPFKEDTVKELKSKNKISNSILKQLDFNKFNHELFKKKIISIKKSHLFFLMAILMPLIIYFAADCIARLKATPIVNNIRSFINMISSKDGISTKIKSKLPKSKRLVIKTKKLKNQ